METEQKKTGKVVIALFVVLLAVAIGLSIWNIKTTKAEVNNSDSPDSSFSIGEAKTYSSSGNGSALSTVEIAKKAKPYVVAVTTYRGGQLDGEGSGIVMSKDQEKNVTYILTCAHIINRSNSSYKVELEDGTAYDAKVVGYDTRTDVGVLSIKGADLTPAEFGDSSVLQVGEPVYAIGNPGGTQFYGSFTAGVVSAIDRPTATSDGGYTMECIQHDAAINPGNSGGALVNSYGQVIGMNSSKIADEEYEGMGFAVPINVAKAVVDDILTVGHVQDRAKLGISYISAEGYENYSAVLQKNQLPNGSIVIAKMDADSCLTGTGAEVGDLITAVNGKGLDTTNVLLKVIEKSKPGDKISLSIAHVNEDGSVKTFDIQVVLGEDTGN